MISICLLTKNLMIVYLMETLMFFNKNGITFKTESVAGIAVEIKNMTSNKMTSFIPRDY